MKTLNHPITQMALCMLCPTLSAASGVPALAGILSPGLARAAYAGYYLAMMTSQTARTKKSRRDSTRR